MSKSGTKVYRPLVTEPIDRIIELDTDWIGAIRFSRDGRLLAAADHDGTLLVWNVRGRAVERRARISSVGGGRKALIGTSVGSSA
jgi:WD40 repeat protein